MNKKTSDATQKKIVSLDDIIKLTAQRQKKGHKVVLSYGAFDLIHPGHIHHLKTAKEMGNCLIVVIDSDRLLNRGPGRPVFNERLRSLSLAALAFVDYVAVNLNYSGVELIQIIKPNLYVKGEEHFRREDPATDELYEEEQSIQAIGGHMAYTGDVVFSSSHLLNSYFPVFTEEAGQFLNEFRKNHTYNELIEKLSEAKELKVLVIGDTIIDEYHYAEALGKSSKASCVVAKYLWEEAYAGGILNIANHIAGFCNQVHLITCLGEQNSKKKFIEDNLKSNITHDFFFRADAPTLIKRRYVHPFQVSKMFEVCYMNDQDISVQLSAEIEKHLEKIIPNFDLVVIADFGHGFITDTMAQTISKYARYVAVNVQANSANLGFNVVTKYPRVDYLCIDEKEVRLAQHDKHGNLQTLILKTMEQLHASISSITLGGEGAVVNVSGREPCKVPIFSQSVVDTVGAGDAFLSITSLCANMGLPEDMIGLIGNAIGAMAVKIVGNKESIDANQLFKYLKTLLK